MYYLESLIGAYHDSQLIITNTLCLSNINTILFALFWISNKIYSQNFYSNFFTGFGLLVNAKVH
jgi:hypothetical protein